MAINGSRYQNTLLFSVGDGQSGAFKGARARAIGAATPVLEYIVKEGDRLDLLALHFYVDSRKWWRILDANPDIVFGADLMLDESIGETILIPRAKEAGASQ
jgi:nucleoid-associated protein YgaU